MTAAEIVVRPCAEAEAGALLALLRASYGVGSERWNEELWAWKHRANPFGPSPCLVAEAGGEPVGMRLFLRWRLRTGDDELRAVRAVDTATRPDWQGRGIFKRLTLAMVERMTEEGVAFVFNTPNRKSGPGYLGMGWRRVGRVPVRVRPLRAGRMLRELLRRWLRRTAAETGEAPGLSAFPGVGELLADPAAAPLLEGAGFGGEGRLHTPRSREYLGWRYRDVPGLDYRALWSVRGRDGAALIFRGRLRGGLREIDLAEILVTRGAVGTDLAAGLLRRLARDAGADHLAAAVARDTPEDAALTRAGFLAPRGWGPWFVVRELAGAPMAPDPRGWAGWRFSLGDLEVL